MPVSLPCFERGPFQTLHSSRATFPSPNRISQSPTIKQSKFKAQQNYETKQNSLSYLDFLFYGSCHVNRSRGFAKNLLREGLQPNQTSLCTFRQVQNSPIKFYEGKSIRIGRCNLKGKKRTFLLDRKLFESLPEY